MIDGSLVTFLLLTDPLEIGTLYSGVSVQVQ
jgi:hypothetical protein